MRQNPQPGLACWAAGQCGALRPVMCGAVAVLVAGQGAWVV